ncbi:MAG: GspH/FimT family pseudopilin [Gemmatimonadales bacterium]
MRRRGFTLIELLIAISVMAILAAIAIPKFASMRLRWSLDGAAQQLIGDLNRARIEALKRNTSVDFDRTGPLGYSIEYLGTRTLPDGVQFTAGPALVIFAAFGPALTGAATFTISLGNLTRDVQLTAAGYAHVP